MKINQKFPNTLTIICGKMSNPEIAPHKNMDIEATVLTEKELLNQVNIYRVSINMPLVISLEKVKRLIYPPSVEDLKKRLDSLIAELE